MDSKTVSFAAEELNALIQAVYEEEDKADRFDRLMDLLEFLEEGDHGK